MNRALPRWAAIALLAFFLMLAAAVGFLIGRLSAPDPHLAFERGRVTGQQQERQRHERTQIELEILKAEISAARSRAEREKPAVAPPAEQPAVGTRK